MADVVQKMLFDASQAISELDKLNGKLNEANTALGAMQGGSGRGVAALDKVEKKTEKTKKKTEELTISWQTMIRVLATQVLVRGLNAVTQGLQDAVESARLLGIAIEEIRTIDSAGRGAEQLSSEILNLSDAIGKAPVDLAEGLYQTLSNQVVAAGDALQFTAEAAKLATVTASETGDAVNALSSVMNSYSMEAGQAEHVAGTLFKTIELGRLRLNEIANVIGRVTPLTSELGIAWEETAASIAVMTRQGVRADTAITQLRAVVTRLIKPTDDMREIFHKWGVDDGKQAIATFGGLTGVLKKLEGETGNSSEGMADLLRNVRAITGALGIMVDDGELVAKVMGQIAEGTEAASNAWEQFRQSDAQKLTQSVQQFQNSMSRLGTQVLPAVNGAMAVLNGFIEAETKGIMALTGQFTPAVKAANLYADAFQRGAAESEKISKAMANVDEDRWDKLSKAANLYYAEANKKERELAKIRDNSIKQATKVLEQAGKNLTEFYKEHIKELENFSKQAAGRIKKNLALIAGIEQDILDQQLDYRLEKEEDNYGKIKILEAELAKNRQAAAKAAQDLTATPESQEAVFGILDRGLDLAKQIRDLEKEGETGTSRRVAAEAQIERIQRNKIAIAMAANDITAEAKTLVDEQIDKEIEGQARIAELLKQKKELYADGNELTKEEQAIDKAITEEISAINKELSKGTDQLKKFGLDDANFAAMVKSLEDALNQATKDWEAERLRAEAEFRNMVLPITLTLDPTGLKREFAESRDIIQGATEGEGTFFRRADVAAVEEQKKIIADETQILGLRAESKKVLDAMGISLAESAKLQKQQTDEAYRSLTPWVAIHKNAEAARESRAQQLIEAKQLTAEGARLQQSYVAMRTDLIANKTVTQEQVQALKNQTIEAYKNQQITKEQALLHVQNLKAISKVAQKTREANKIEAELPSREKRQLLDQVLGVQQQILDAEKTEAQVAAESEASYQANKAAMEGTVQPANSVATASGEVATNASSAATSTEAIGTNAAGSVGNLNAAASAAGNLAGNLERAARAAASIGGGGGVQSNPHLFAGGRVFAANGRLFRGQDRTLVSAADGETIINKQSSRRFFSELNAMNQGSQPAFREQGGPVTNVGDVNVTVQGGDSSQQTVREIGHALRREIQRGNIKLR
jgi:TP901 family phage tail tape measure protein